MSHRRTVNHAEQIGNLQPISLPAGPSSEELRAALAAHELRRPDHLAAMHPHAPAYLRREWSEWCDRKAHLTTQLHMAESREANVWRDANGNPVHPEAWAGGLRDLSKMTKGSAA